MSLNSMASAERVHIGFFGLRNAGKSSLVNAITGQKLSVVSDVLGTTTDPVKKAMELLPLGPVVIIDTPGLDDTGVLGEQRVARAKQMLNQTNIAVLVTDCTKSLSQAEIDLISLFKNKSLPYIIAYNKADLLTDLTKKATDGIFVSAEKSINIDTLKNKIAEFARNNENTKTLLDNTVVCGDTVVLVIPIDESAPKGRLILPQQHTIRELLDKGAGIVISRETELKATLEKLKSKPRLVITDSQVFGYVSKIVPNDVLLTSFSILFARYKGDLATVVAGASQLDRLNDGDKILISEGCTHHRQCKDIGTVKMPQWISEYSRKELSFEFTSGTEFPEATEKYALIVHCGGCMLNEKEMKSRIERCKSNGTPVTNYGIAIAQMNGILKRSVELFPDISNLLL